MKYPWTMYTLKKKRSSNTKNPTHRGPIWIVDLSNQYWTARLTRSNINYKKELIKIICVYVPNGNPVDTDKYQYKIKWLKSFERFLVDQNKLKNKVIIGGDFNIIPNEVDVYNPEDLNKKINGIPQGDVSSAYMDDGYLFFNTDPVETAVYNDTIDFEVRIQEGPQATIKTIRIAGNDKTTSPITQFHVHEIGTRVTNLIHSTLGSKSPNA